MKKSTLIKSGVATIVAAATVFSGGLAANAEPGDSSNSGPTARTFVAVGSDTIQDVWNALTNGYGSTAGYITSVGSYNAFPIVSSPSTAADFNIQSHSGGATFLRPAGSGNGAKALSAAWNTSNHNWLVATGVDANGNAITTTQALTSTDVSFSRSSSKPGSAYATTAGAANDNLTYIPFARDAVSVATKGIARTSFSTSELTEIYSGVNDPSNDVTGATDNVSVSGGHAWLGTQQLDPKVPQSGSGTRSFFLGAIGVSTLAPYIVASPSTPENDGTQLTANGQLIPFSAAQWIAQNTAATGVTNTTAGVTLVKINGVSPFKLNTDGTVASPLKPGDLYGAATAPVTGSTVGTFARDTYNVIPTSQANSSSPLFQILSNRSPATVNVGNATAKATIEAFGFLQVSYNNTPGYYLHSDYQN